jgi:hypothetical protein
MPLCSSHNIIDFRHSGKLLEAFNDLYQIIYKGLYVTEVVVEVDSTRSCPVIEVPSIGLKRLGKC